MKSPISGKTRWRRFAVLFVPAFAAAGTMVFLAATGALAINLAISGIPFKLSASQLTGSNFVQFAGPDQVTNAAAGALIPGLEGTAGITPPAGSTPTQVAADLNTYTADTETYLNNASITGLHQTVCAPMYAALGLPYNWFPHAYLQVTIDAGGMGTPASTIGPLVVQAPGLSADSATFTDMKIGQDAHSALTQYGYPLPSPDHTSGLFSQAAGGVSITNIKQIAVGTEAASFTLPNLAMSAAFVDTCS